MADLDERLAALVDDWGRHAPPRRPRNGHRADCPDQHLGHIRRCRHCIADVIGREPRDVKAIHELNEPRDFISAPVNTGPELRQCPRCYSPTTEPERHCT
jgi:hypothetical protein